MTFSKGLKTVFERTYPVTASKLALKLLSNNKIEQPQLNTLAVFHINPLTTSFPHHIETSQLICNTNQLTGFYMMGNIGRLT